MTLTAIQEQFILHWGEMGAKWGLNRTIAQIHALLYLSPKPLNAEEIATTLSVARSNVSNSIKELQGWGVIGVTHVMGDRRDHFESMKDVWEMFRVVLDERKKRETDPTLRKLQELTAKAKKAGAKEAHTHERLAEMLEFFETMTNWYEQIRRLPTGATIKFARMGDKVRKWLGVA